MPLVQGEMTLDNSDLDNTFVYSGEAKGRNFDQMLPRLLLRLPANALRDQVKNQNKSDQFLN